MACARDFGNQARWRARQFDFQTKFIELAGDVNTQMPYYVVQRTMDALNESKRSVNGSKLLVLGAAYKNDIDDIRESPSLRIISLLKQRGATVHYHDPYVPELHQGHAFDCNLKSVALSSKLLPEYDAVIILTNHSCVDYAQVVEGARLVIDARNATRNLTQHREKIVKA
jgi:UDP-N-acetyl-D-glucosamine dehydrogenase